jgi:hypothetical protein
MHARRRAEGAPVTLNSMGSLSRSNSITSMDSFDDQYEPVNSSEVRSSLHALESE